MNFKIAILLILISNVFTLRAQNNKALHDELEELYKKSDFPGFSVAIVNEEGAVYQDAFGYADIKSKKPYTISSVQNIGSISKAFIGLALMKAIEMGYFNLETDINTVLPFKVSNPNLKAKSIKIKHLVTHTSGILDDENTYSKSFLLNKYSDKKSPLYRAFVKEATIKNRQDTTLLSFFKNYFETNGKWYKKTNFTTVETGSQYNYSNIGSTLAAYLIEVKSDMSFDSFCSKYIFDPLKMNNTAWQLNDDILRKHTQIYNSKKQFYPLYSAITYPDGNLKTSCKDLSNYLGVMIKGYKGEGNLLYKNTFETLFKKQFSDDKLPENSDPKEPNSGVFWKYKKNGNIGHTGSDLGVTSFMFFNPETGIGKVFLTNIEFDNPKNGKTNEKLVAQFISIWKVLEKYENKKPD